MRDRLTDPRRISAGPNFRRAFLFAGVGVALALLMAVVAFALMIVVFVIQQPFPAADPLPTPDDATVATAVYSFSGYVGRGAEPCVASSDASDPCSSGRTVQFPGVVPKSLSYPDEPPTLEAMLLNSWDGRSLSEVPGHALLSATHIVARGRFKDGSLRCEQYPVVNPSWAVDHAALGVADPPEGERVVVHFGIDHWMCFAELSVHEYLAGIGGGEVIVNLAAAAVPLDSGVDIRSVYDEPTLDMYRAAVADHFFGSDWVVWLGPSYSTAAESWTAYSLWDVQRGDDGVVRVVSPVADHYEGAGLTGSALERLRAPLADFRRDIRSAHESRVRRTSGRIGVGTDTPELVTDVYKLEDYYEEVGAYHYPIATPAPAPFPPEEPGDLAAQMPDDEGGITLSWSAPASGDVTGYKVVRRVPKGEFVTVVADTGSTETTYTDTSAPMTAGVTYIYRVIALNEYGESLASNRATVELPGPDAPADFTATNYEGDVVLTWSQPGVIMPSCYRIYRRAQGEQSFEWVVNCWSADLRSWRDDDVVSGTRYIYRIVPMIGSTESGATARASVRVR